MFKKPIRALGFLGAALAMLPMAVQPVPAAATGSGTLFAITRSQNLVTVDPGSGFLTQVTSLFPNCSGNCPLDSQSFELASDPANHRLYAVRVESFSFNFPPVFVVELLTIDTQSGQILSHPQFLANPPGELAFDTSTHTLFGFTGTEIVTVDPTTTKLTHFATVGGGFGSFIYQMTMSASSHKIFLSQEDISLPAPPNPTQVFTVDTTTAAVSTGLVLDAPVRWIVADGSSLFGITDNALNVVGINTITGATTFVANVGFNSFIPTGPTVDPTTHTIYVDVTVSDPVFHDQLFAVDDQSVGVAPSHPIFGESLTSIAFEAPPQVTPQSIKDDVRSALASGAIDNAGVANSLLATLSAAADARTRTAASGARVSACSTSADIYRAFINQVTALSGMAASSTRGHIAAATATQLISEAQFLIANCP